MAIEKMKRDDWIAEASRILQAKPYNWTKTKADEYAEALTESFYDVDDEDDYMSPEEAIAEDSSYWD
jgi:hypothetical protein